MRVAHVMLVIGLALVLLVVLILVRSPTSLESTADGFPLLLAAEPEVIPPLLDPSEVERPHTVYDISLHEAKDLRLLLGRLEMLANQPRPQTDKPDIALVLHGPELDYFAIRNYAEHRELVDLAAKLDAFQAIEIKACRTMMRKLELEPTDIPAFIEIVPFGPEEVKRLEVDGYLKM